MKRFNNYILEKKLEDIYDFLCEDGGTEEDIRQRLDAVWDELKNMFNRNTYLSNSAQTQIGQSSAIEIEPRRPEKTPEEINTQNAIKRIMNGNVLSDRLKYSGKMIKAAELYDDDDNICGILVFSVYKSNEGVNRYVILGLECTKLDDPSIVETFGKIAKNMGCLSPMYVSKPEYDKNQSFYDKENFMPVNPSRQSDLFYMQKEF